jgi:predicted MPP superfamily phosphohydrolase
VSEPALPTEQWETVQPGLVRKIRPGGNSGPWFQYHDAVGFEWNTYAMQIADLPAELDGYRILHLSDLHCRSHWQTAYDDLIQRLNADEPDLILITGDINDWIQRPWVCLPTARRFLCQLRAPGGVLGILGNHDFYVDPQNFNGTPLRMIDGQRLLIPARNKTIEVIAVPGPWREDCPPGFETSFPPKSREIPRIIMSHFPDHIRRMKVMQSDIFLAGHTHGGQACLPGRIPIIRHDSLPMKYFLGIHRMGKTWFVVNRGLGFSTLPIRIFCPAEVIEIVLKK